MTQGEDLVTSESGFYESSILLACQYKIPVYFYDAIAKRRFSEGAVMNLDTSP